MPTISGTVVTFIPYEEAKSELEKALDVQTGETIAKLILEFGAGVVVGKFIKFLNKKINTQIEKDFEEKLEKVYDAAVLGVSIADALNGDENELITQLRILDNRGKGYALRIETTYSEWISGSGNHSCNYQCENEYSIVLYT